jgi:hypothetical protein
MATAVFAAGSSYVKISRNIFGCAAARNKGTCTNRLNTRIQVLGDGHVAQCAARCCRRPARRRPRYLVSGFAKYGAYRRERAAMRGTGDRTRCK